jgi:hypothetical protein
LLWAVAEEEDAPQPAAVTLLPKADPQEHLLVADVPVEEVLRDHPSHPRMQPKPRRASLIPP